MKTINQEKQESQQITIQITSKRNRRGPTADAAQMQVGWFACYRRLEEGEARNSQEWGRGPERI